MLKEMKAITLVNPAGQRKELSNVEFFEMQMQFAKSKAAQKWSTDRNIALWLGKEQKLAITAVNMFLKEMGYKIIDNLHDVDK